jgi:hypothetical protein
MANKETGWYGFDLDSTLAVYNPGDFQKHGWKHIGEPIQPMVDLVKRLLSEGKRVKIFTARMCDNDPWDNEIRNTIQGWCETHIGERLEATNVKDFECIVIYDDRAVTVEVNTGKVLGVNQYE